MAVARFLQYSANKRVGTTFEPPCICASMRRERLLLPRPLLPQLLPYMEMVKQEEDSGD